MNDPATPTPAATAQLRPLLDYTLAGLESLFESRGQQRYRARQVFTWLWKKDADRFDEMTDLPVALRAELSQWFGPVGAVVDEQRRAADGALKLRIRLADGNAVETVLMPEDDRVSICLSCQVGCALGCAFCRTGGMGFVRNLSPAEILVQYRLARQAINDERRIGNVVFMGMGEPFMNLQAVMDAVEVFTCRQGVFISPRYITVSTAGFAALLKEFPSRCSATLALSLNATTDETRRQLMPVAARNSIADLTAALLTWPPKRRERLFLEYVLIDGVNVSPGDARRLTGLARRLGCKVNLIPFNPHEASRFRPPSPDAAAAFQRDIWDAGVQVTLRNSRGGDIAAACGQLACRVTREE